MAKQHKGLLQVLAIILVFLLTDFMWLPLTAFAAQGEGNTYYVSYLYGNDANTGTSSSSAWQTLSKIASMQFQPGDTILLDAQSVWNERLVLTGEANGSGTLQSPIVISRYNHTSEEQRPIINAGGTTMADTLPTNMLYRFGGAIELHNMDYWHVEWLEVTNTGEKQDAQRVGILVMGDAAESYSDKTDSQCLSIYKSTPKRQGVQVNNCYIHDVNGAYEGVSILNPATGGTTSADKMSSGILFLGKTDAYATGNHVKNICGEGIRNAAQAKGVWSSTYYAAWVDVVFRNNYIEEVSGDGMVLSCTTSGIAEYNVVRAANNYNSGRNYAALWMMGTHNTVAQYNEVFDTKYAAADGEAFDFDSFCENSLYQYNYSHNNKGGLILFMPSSTNNVFRYNVSVNDGIEGAGRNHLFFYTYSQSTSDAGVALIHNNTIMVGPSTGVIFDASNKAERIKFYNNILLSVNGNTPAFTNNAFSTGSISGNVVYPASMLANSAYTQGVSASGNVYANPLLTAPGTVPENVVPALTGTFNNEALAAYKVQADSPAIGAGVDVSELTPDYLKTNYPLTTDIFGNEIDFNNITAGAHQFSNDAGALEIEEALPQALLPLSGETTGVVGTTITLATGITTEGVWNSDIIWESGDTQIAAIQTASNDTAVISLKAPGTATITAKSSANPAAWVSVDIIVEPVPTLEGILLSSDTAYLENTSGTYPAAQLTLAGRFSNGLLGELPSDNIEKITYTLDEQAKTFAEINPQTGLLTITGDTGSADSISVTANVFYQQYEYENSFESGTFGDMLPYSDSSPTTGTVGVGVQQDAGKAHSGSYYLASQAASVGGSSIRRIFDEPQYGTVTMWLYDDLSAAGASGSKVGLAGNVIGTTNSNNNFIGIYSDGATGNASYYSYRPNTQTSGWVTTTIPRTTGWHELKWVFTQSALFGYIDNEMIFSNTYSGGFDTISVATNWAQTFTGSYSKIYFDDVRYASQPATAFVSEPLVIYLNPTKPIAVKVTSANGSSVVGGIGNTLQMVAEVFPAGLPPADKAVTWAVENLEGEATITESGLLTGVSAGSVKVIARSLTNNTVYAEMLVTVKEQPTLIDSIAITSASGSLAIADYQGSLQMQASYTPQDADDTEIVWSVTDVNFNATNVATIDANGLLRATGITVHEGISVTVQALNPASGISISVQVSIKNQTEPLVLAQTIVAGGDTFVKDGTSNENTNYGDLEIIEVKEVGAGYTRRGLLLFDVTDLDAAQYEKITLRLYLTDFEYGSWQAKPMRLYAYATNETGWNEGTINFADSTLWGMPASAASGSDSEEKTVAFSDNDATALGYVEITTPVQAGVSLAGQCIELDITSYLNSHNDITALSIALGAQYNSQCFFKFASKENADTALAPVLALYLANVVDKSELQAFYSQYQSLSREDGFYTKASWDNFVEKMGAAQAVLSNVEALNADVQYTLANLQSAVNALTIQANSTLAELQALYNMAMECSEADYTTTSYKALQAALTETKALLDSGEGCTPIARLNSYIQLEDAIAALVYCANSALLKNLATLIDEYENVYEESRFDIASWQAYISELENAKNLLKKSQGDISQEEAETTMAALNAAVNSLTERTYTKELLKIHIETAQALLAQEEKYVPEHIEALRNAYSIAVSVYEASESQGEIDTAGNTLAAAIAALDEKADRYALHVLVTVAKAKVEANYTPSTWGQLAQSLAAAEEVLVNTEAYSKQAVDSAAEALQAALNALVNKPILSGLQQAIAAAEALIASSDLYLDASVAGVATKLEEAHLVWDNPEASQAMVNNAATALNYEVANARKKAMLNHLMQALQQAKSIDTNLYTQASVLSLLQAIEYSEALSQADEQAQINEAVAMLYSAIASLVAQPAPKQDAGQTTEENTANTNQVNVNNNSQSAGRQGESSSQSAAGSETSESSAPTDSSAAVSMPQTSSSGPANNGSEPSTSVPDTSSIAETQPGAGARNALVIGLIIGGIVLLAAGSVGFFVIKKR